MTSFLVPRCKPVTRTCRLRSCSDTSRRQFRLRMGHFRRIPRCSSCAVDGLVAAPADLRRSCGTAAACSLSLHWVHLSDAQHQSLEQPSIKHRDDMLWIIASISTDPEPGYLLCVELAKNASNGHCHNWKKQLLQIVFTDVTGKVFNGDFDQWLTIPAPHRRSSSHEFITAVWDHRVPCPLPGHGRRRKDAQHRGQVPATRPDQ